VTSAQRVGLAVLVVLGGSALALRAADTCAGVAGDLPRGVRRCASLAEAKARTGLDLAGFGRALAGESLVPGEIRRRHPPAVAVVVRRAEAPAALLTFYASRGGEIPPALRPPLASFHELEVPLAPGKTASLRAATTADGSFWQDLEWSSGQGRAALRGQGRTVDLLRLARRIVEGTP